MVGRSLRQNCWVANQARLGFSGSKVAELTDHTDCLCANYAIPLFWLSLYDAQHLFQRNDSAAGGHCGLIAPRRTATIGHTTFHFAPPRPKRSDAPVAIERLPALGRKRRPTI